MFFERFLFDEIDRGFVRLQTGLALFAIDHAVVFHAEFANEDRKSQALENERREDDAEGEKQNVAAARKGLAVCQAG